MNKIIGINRLCFKGIFYFTFFISIFFAGNISAQSTNCTNSNFENGDFSNWQGGTGTPNGNSGNNPGGCCAIVINQFLNAGALLPPRHSITTSITDPNTQNNLIEVAPGGGIYSARLGSWQNSFYSQNNPGPFPGSKAEMVKFTFTVTPNSELFVYQYAVVLEDPDTNVSYHTPAQKPRFEIKVLDGAGAYVPNAQCGHYIVTADSNVAGWHEGLTTSASVIHYKDWTTVGIDLTAYLGQTITILFQVGDCALGGHMGYAYIDAYCAPLQVLTQYCVGQNQVTLTAPPGFSYHWMPGGDTTQTVTLTNPTNGSVYTCDLISVTGCVATISTIVQPTIITPNFNYQVDCNLNTALFADATIILNGTIQNWSWNFGDGSPVMNGVQNPVHTYPGPGTYNVQLIITAVAGCMDTINLLVTIPLVAVDAPSSTICTSSFVTINASGGNSYSWSPSVGLNVTTGATVQASPTVNTTYTVTVYNANGCSGTTTAIVNIAPNIVVNISAATTSVCAGHTTTLTANGGNNYTWSPSIGLSSSTGSTVTAYPTTNTTYSVVVTNAAGCSGQANIPITLVPNPGIAVSSQAICSGQSATLNVLGANTYQWSNGGTGGAITVSPVANTSYTVIGFVGACTDTATGIVIVSPLPVINAISSGNICLTGTVTLSAGGANTYTWSPSVGFSSSTGSTISGSPLINSTYTVIGTDLNGCSSLTTVTVAVHNPPVISASASPSILCVGSSTVLTATGAPNYYWSPSTGLASTTGNSILAYPPSSTTYTVIGIDTFGCADTTAVPVTISPGPAINISSTSSTICYGDSATLNSTGANTYSWSPSTGLNISTGSSVIASPALTTSYLVTAMDSLGCIANAISIVSVNPLPIVTSVSTGLICGSGTVQLTAAGATSYQWNPSTGLSATIGNNINASISSTITYTVTGTNLNGCSANSSVTVTANPIPVISAIPSSAILCTSSSASLTASGGVNYFWSPSTGLSATTGNPIQATPTVSTTYSVIGIDANGCSSNSTVSLAVSAGPPLNLTTTNPVVCIGDSTVLNATGASNYIWSPSTSLSASTGATVTATPTVTTTYSVSSIDISGCVASTLSTVVVNPIPVINVTALSPAFCFGEATAMTASGATAYTWSPAADLSASTGSTVSANPSVTTTYTIVGSNTFGCTSSTQYVLTVNPLPVISVTANNPMICFGETTTLTATGALFYNWSPSNNLSSSTGSTVQASPQNSTIFTIIGTDANGCSSATSSSVTVNQLPSIVLSSTDSVICNLSSATLTATGGTIYSWSPSTGLSSSTGSPVQASPNSNITYTVTVTTSFGCIDSSTIDIDVNPLPTVILLSSNPAYCPGGSSILTASGANTYSWSPSNGLNLTIGDTVIANPLSTTTYTVTGVDSNGCSINSTSIVVVNPVPVITTSAPDSICINLSTTLTASGAVSYSWSPSIGLNLTIGSSVLASPLSNTTYTVTGTDINGCTALANLPLVVNPLPIIISSTSTPTVCLNSSTTLTANGALSYSWSPSTALSATIGNSVISTPTSAISYTVTGIDLNGCSANSSVNVGVNQLPIVTSVDASICNGLSTSMTAMGANTYIWSPNTNLSSTNGSIVTANPTLTITYSILGTDLNGCTGTTTSTVTVNPLPIIIPSASPTICLNQTATLTVIGATTYNWSPSTGLNIATGDTVSASPITSTVYTVSGTDLNGCSASSTIPVAVNPLPTIISTSSTPILCLNSSTTLTVSGASTYSWSPSTALSATIGNSVISTPTSAITYTVTGIDVNGCSANSTVSVGVNPLPVVTSADAAICFGTSTTLTVTGANTYTWSPNTNLSSSVGASVIANPTSTIVYSILGTDLNGCTGTTNSTVTVNPLPVIIPSTSPTICLNQTAILSVSGATTYNWSPSTGLNVATGDTVSASPITSTIYTVSGTDLNGCSASSTIPVTVNSLPTIISTTSTPAVCLNSSTTLTASGATTYLWSPSTALSASTGNSVASTPTSAITYTVTGIDLNGCSANSTVTVGVNPLPIVTSADAAICFGTSTTLSGTGANTYIWSPNTNLSSTNGSTVTANPITTITYSILGTDLNGCTGTTTSTVTVNPLPVITVSSVDSILCNGESATIIAAGGSVYNWSPSIGLNFVTGDTIIANPIVNTTYTVVGFNSFGCQSSNSISIVVNQIPPVTVANNPFICPGDFATLVATGAVNYHWSTNALGNTISVNPLVNTTYSVIGTDANNCTAGDTALVSINPVPVISAVAQQSTLCVGQSTNITASGAVSYEWSPSIGLSATTGSTVSANPTTTSTYTIIGTNATGCVDTTTISITINVLPVAAAGPDENVCIGSSVQLNASGGTTYSWYPASLLDNANISNPIANTTNSTSFIVIVGNQFNCYSSDTLQVIVHALPNVDAGLSNVVCYPASTQLHGNGALTYFWLPALYLNDSLIQNPICTPLDNITYTLTATDTLGCIASDTVSVKVLNPFQIVANPNEMICYNSQVQLNATGGYNYLWSPMTGLDNAYIANPIASPSYTTTYTVYSTDGICFSASDTVIVTVNQLPLIYAGADAAILFGQSYQLYGYSSSGGSVQWSPPDFLSCTDCPDPMVVHINIPMTYKLTVTDSLGCKAEDYVSIHLACSDDMVYVPDAFTPNADGKNDIFRVRTYALSHITAFRVFNRWGEMVFETYDVSQGWDGTWQGQLCTPAVYVWYIEGNCADGSEVKKKGNVTLIR